MIVRFSHDLCNTIFQTRFEKTDNEGNVKMIRLIEGSNNVDESKQDKQAKQKQFRTGFANTRVGDEVFYQVEITDKSVINFLKETPYWGKHINEYDPLAESKEKSKQFVSQASLLMDIATMAQDDLLALGYARIGNKALKYAQDKDYEGLRLTVATEAQEDYEGVSSLVGDKKNADKLMVGLAFAKGIVLETEAGNTVSWGHNNSKIINVPSDVTPLDAIVEFFGEAEGREVKKQIFQKIGKKAVESKVSKATANKEEDADDSKA